MRDTDNITTHLRCLFDLQRLAVPAIPGEHGPYANPVAFSSSGNLTYLYFATTRSNSGR